MIVQIFEALQRIKNKLDVPEHRDTFADEIGTLKQILGCIEPSDDFLTVRTQQEIAVQRLRMLAVETEGLETLLPDLPIENWFDGTIKDATKDVNFNKSNLSELIRFIADMVEF